MLKINDNDIANVVGINNDLRDNILYMLCFEKLIKEEANEKQKLL